MKLTLSMAGFFLALAAAASLRAQNPPTNVAPTVPALPDYQAHYNHVFDGMFPYLTADQRAEFEKALYPALQKRPDLAAEGETLLQEGAKKTPLFPDDRAAYGRKMHDYEGRLRQAVVAENPDVALIFDQIETHVFGP